MYYLGIIIASLLGYLIGSVSWSIIIVRWRRGIDIRTYGSKNAGATNTTRLLGKGWGLLAAFLDGLKVVLTAFIAFFFSFIPSELFSQTSYFIPCLFVLIGHCWPVFYKFKGGKAVACFLGLIFISNIWYLLIFLLVWFISAAISRRVSVASIIGALVIGIVIWLPWINGLTTFAWQWNSYDIWWDEAWSNPWLRFSWMNYLHVISTEVSHQQNFASGMLEIQIINLIGGFILIIRHWPNIFRLWHKQEPQTFPKLTAEEKKKLRYLQHQPKPTMAERKEIRRLEKIQKLEQKAKKITLEMKNQEKQQPKKEDKVKKIEQKIDDLDHASKKQKVNKEKGLPNKID